ncbi:hypothetical protein B6I21_03480 [candidate division KSB1 bacterium 4572_119]|nr:MAG: hypothetical protein B6I21_03480 [candidate division KSB1 bacterium 4572_119]
MRGFKAITILFLLFTLLPCWAANDYLPAKNYHNYSSLTKSLKELAAKNKSIVKLSSIGKTYQGRDIWALQITGNNGKKALDKQALLVCGNLEGDHVIGSEVALGIARYLIEGYNKNKEITELLDKRTFYILPRVNPDGAELFFQNMLAEYSGNLNPRDDDYDWETDEDGPEDLNGDGLITLMRVKDKEGSWYADKKDPRIMKKKDKDTPVESLYNIYPEGFDNDGDELYNEDGPGGYNINRNFPHNFGYKIKGYKLYPASESETQAVIDFMNKYQEKFETAPHKNICGVLLFSKYDNLAAGSGIESGKAMFPEFKRKGEVQPQRSFRFGRRRSGDRSQQQGKPKDPQSKKTDKNDVTLFKNVSKQYKEITGLDYAVSEKPVGSMLEWSYFQYGVPSFSANLWSLRKDKKEKADSTDQKQEKPDEQKMGNMDRRASMMQRVSGRPGGKTDDKKSSKSNDANWLKWIEKQNNGVGFVNWEKFQHEQLGEVEIGGFYPYLRVNPPAEQIDSLSKSHAKFAMYLASQFAEIKMDKPVIEKMSSNLFKLKVKIHNSGKFPYATSMGLKSRNISPIVLQLKFEDEKEMKLFGGSKRVDTSSLAAGAEKELEWVIISPAGKKIDIKLWARNGGGTIKKQVVLK